MENIIIDHMIFLSPNSIVTSSKHKYTILDIKKYRFVGLVGLF